MTARADADDAWLVGCRRACDDVTQESQRRRAGEEPVQGRWHESAQREGRIKPLATGNGHSRLQGEDECRPKKRLTKELHAWRFVGSFDATPRPVLQPPPRPIAPRTLPATPLHSSKWQGAYPLQLPAGSSQAARLRGARRRPKDRLDTDGPQLDLPREPCSPLPEGIPEARRCAPVAEGATATLRLGDDGRVLTRRTQSRGRWMIPAYKVILYTSISSSMYMMGRLVLVRWPRPRCMDATLTVTAGTQDVVRQELSNGKSFATSERQQARVVYGPQCTNNQQSLSQWHRFPLFLRSVPPASAGQTGVGEEV